MNSGTDVESYSGSAYVLIRDPALWYKASIGYSKSNYLTKNEIPVFALLNNSSIKQKNIYADLAIYNAETYLGFRPLVGVTINRSQIDGVESGSPLLSTMPPNGTKTHFMPYVGTRYEFSKGAAIETRVVHSPDYKTVISNRGILSENITDNVSVNATIGFDKGVQEKYNNFYGMIGLKVSF
jgi:hypothetical protein